MRMGRTIGVVLLVFGLGHNLAADEIHAAVAANITSPFKVLAEKFEQSSGHKVIATFSSTGKFYAQIINGAPFDVFYAADLTHPEKLVAAGHALEDSLYTYALGKLVLWSPDPNQVDAKGLVLKKAGVSHIALPNPKTAPYGVAAEQTLAKMKLLDKLRPKLVQAETLTQVHQLALTGKAQLAFLALSQLKEGGAAQGSHWVVPADFHAPIAQGAVILKKTDASAALSTSNSEAVKAFVEFMRGPEAAAVIQEYGYQVESGD
jgi:molybdate transport system substrate-binding protein